MHEQKEDKKKKWFEEECKKCTFKIWDVFVNVHSFSTEPQKWTT